MQSCQVFTYHTERRAPCSAFLIGQLDRETVIKDPRIERQADKFSRIQ